LVSGGVPVNAGARLAVRDPHTGATLPPGASGELWIDAPSRFVEYLEDPAATARAFDAAGMFRTGDLGRLAGDGFVFEARIGDAMRLGGFLVSPEEIEAVIQAQPGVAGVQVVGLERRVRPGAGCLRAAGSGDGARRGSAAGALPRAIGAVQGPRTHCDGRCVPDRRRPKWS
jgi:fatty-acyl-CoA synthase